MTHEDALAIADKPDWWMGPDGPRESMRTLRAALNDIAGCTDRAYLFRPGGFGAPAIWLTANEVDDLRKVLASQSDRAA